MSMEQILSATNISASGLSAERLRLEVAANNIANAHSTRSVDGGPYKRQQVVFSSAMQSALGIGRAPHHQPAGVRVVGVRTDPAEHPMVYNPGHPDANAEGFVMMPNVRLAHEMVDLMTASRAYEANLKSLQTFRQLAEQALSLLRGLQ